MAGCGRFFHFQTIPIVDAIAVIVITIVAIVNLYRLMELETTILIVDAITVIAMTIVAIVDPGGMHPRAPDAFVWFSRGLCTQKRT